MRTPMRSATLVAASIALLSAMSSAPTSVAQEPTPLPVVATLLGGGEEALWPRVQAFIDGMEQLGWYDGVNVHYEHRFAGGDFELRTRYVEEVVALEPAAIITGGTGRVREFTALNPNIPVLTVQASAAQVAELVANFDRPEGNFTAIAAPPVTPAQRLLLAQELVPGATTIGWLVSPEGDEDYRQGILDAADDLGINLILGEALAPEAAVAALESVASAGAEVVIVPGGGTFNTAVPTIVAAAPSVGLPIIYQFEGAAELGGLISQGVDIPNRWHILSYYVDRLLRGETVADLPVRQDDFQLLLVNPEAADAIGLEIPSSIMARATVVGE